MQISESLLHSILARLPGLNKHALVKELRRLGCGGITTHDLNAFIYRRPDVFEWKPGTGYSRLWFLKGQACSANSRQATSPARARVLPPAPRLRLFPWQQRALDAWRTAGHIGIVEAVTGAGKTRLALQAISDALIEGHLVCVLVPTIDLMRQWQREIERHLIKGLGLQIRLGCLGGGANCELDGRLVNVLIASAQSGSRYDLLPEGHRGLLVADEVHHYGAETWALALEGSFQRRLGLTATYEREDNGLESFLDPYFREVVYSLDYEEALADGVISPFRIAFVGVRFSHEEQACYDEASRRASKHRKLLIDQFWLPAEPFGQFIRECHHLAKSQAPGSRTAGFYLSAFSRRRAIMAESNAKLEAIHRLAEAVKGAQRTVIFAQTKQAAESAIGVLRSEGLRGAVLSADTPHDDRCEVLGDFEDGTHEVVAAPKLLDEGVDVPAADLAILLATSRSRRQLVQRMGRVLRRKPDQVARIAILYVEGTSEDPAEGAHEDFLEDVLETAEEVSIFKSGDCWDDVLAALWP